jgi:hypothetical protein
MTKLVIAPCSLVEVYQRFRGPCCLHNQGDELVMYLQTSSNVPYVYSGGYVCIHRIHRSNLHFDFMVPFMF